MPDTGSTRPTDLDDFQHRVAEWGNRTFPLSNRRSKTRHLINEVYELERETSLVDHQPARIAEEAADCLLLLLHICAEQGVSLAAAAEAKFAEVQTRTWGPADADGVVEHVRGADHA